MKRCAKREDGCTRPDRNGFIYEYWADEDGEHKGSVVAMMTRHEVQDMQDGRKKKVRIEWNGVTLKLRCHIAQMPGGSQMIDTNVWSVMFSECQFGSMTTHAELGRKHRTNADGSIMTPAEIMRETPISFAINKDISSEGYGGE